VIVTAAGSTVVLDADSTADAFGATAISTGLVTASGLVTAAGLLTAAGLVTAAALVTGTAATAEAVTVAFAGVRAAGAFFGIGSAAICGSGASTIGRGAICDDDS
jgi:hypothetical protein